MNELVRAHGGMPIPGTRQGNWVWDGQQWLCGPCDEGPMPPCPPPGWPPPGCPPWFSGLNSPPWYPGANAGVSFGTTAPQNPVRGHFWWNGNLLALFDGAVWVNTATGAIVPPSGGTGGGGGSGQGTVVISTQPPGNPVSGMQWWDGTVLRVYDGTQWNIVGPGASAGPVPTTTHSFAMTQPTAVTFAANAWTILPFSGNPTIDPQIGYDNIAHTWRPNKAGVYNFNIRALTVGGSTGLGIALLKNDNGSFDGASNQNIVAISTVGGAFAAWVTAAGAAVMNGTTDFVRMFIYDSAGTIAPAGGNSLIDAWLAP